MILLLLTALLPTDQLILSPCYTPDAKESTKNCAEVTLVARDELFQSRSQVEFGAAPISNTRSISSPSKPSLALRSGQYFDTEPKCTTPSWPSKASQPSSSVDHRQFKHIEDSRIVILIQPGLRNLCYEVERPASRVRESCRSV
ncbi:uncharacterized protein BKA78DRAFT_42946 [Phyllosticta capitalensis]|uniref:uncharacterized protein n=1 Tax=Phyllosticta capitalensis TaxID=121624 RepID=UPI00312E496E